MPRCLLDLPSFSSRFSWHRLKRCDPGRFPAAESRWEGCVRHDFQVDGVKAIVVEPKVPRPGRPWAWRGEFFGAFPNADIELLKHGWHLAYLEVPDLFGSPQAMKD